MASIIIAGLMLKLMRLWGDGDLPRWVLGTRYMVMASERHVQARKLSRMLGWSMAIARSVKSDRSGWVGLLWVASGAACKNGLCMGYSVVLAIVESVV